jgi:hypothetical protein
MNQRAYKTSRRTQCELNIHLRKHYTSSHKVRLSMYTYVCTSPVLPVTKSYCPCAHTALHVTCVHVTCVHVTCAHTALHVSRSLKDGHKTLCRAHMSHAHMSHAHMSHAHLSHVFVPRTHVRCANTHETTVFSGMKSSCPCTHMGQCVSRFSTNAYRSLRRAH